MYRLVQGPGDGKLLVLGRGERPADAEGRVGWPVGAAGAEEEGG